MKCCLPFLGRRGEYKVSPSNLRDKLRRSSERLGLYLESATPIILKLDERILQAPHVVWDDAKTAHRDLVLALRPVLLYSASIARASKDVVGRGEHPRSESF